MKKNEIFGIAAMTLAGLAIFGAGEVVFRSVFPEHPKILSRRNFAVKFDLSAVDLPGIRREASNFWTNSQGFRGREILPGDVHRIVAIGGSTTECFFVDQNITWTARLERLLSERIQGQVWVGAAAWSGMTLEASVDQADRVLRFVPAPTAAIFLIGANDMLKWLGDQGGSALDPDDEIRPKKPASGWMRAYRALKSVLGSDLVRGVRPVPARFAGKYNDLRKMRARAAAYVDELPDPAPALRAYRENILKIREICRRKGVTAVFVTQPTIWRGAADPEIERLLWMGGVPAKGRIEYYSASALSRGMEIFNQALLGICREEGLNCLDAAGKLPSDTRTFYDDMHFNEDGSEALSGLLAEHLMATVPGLRKDDPKLP